VAVVEEEVLSTEEKILDPLVKEEDMEEEDHHQMIAGRLSIE
jgi:hypothetical protein